MSGIALFPIVLVFGAVFTVLMLLLAGKRRPGAMGVVALVAGLAIAGVFLLHFDLATVAPTSRVVTQSSGAVYQRTTPVLGPMVFVFGFIFIFFVAMLVSKGSGKAGIGVLIGVVLFLVGFFVFVPVMRHRRVQYKTQHPAAAARVESDQWARSTAVSPIWSEGVAGAFDADVYPSKNAAVRALGSRLHGWLHPLVSDTNQPPGIVLFQQEQERSLLWELEHALEGDFPDVSCTIEAGLRNIEPDEIGITLGLENTQVVQPTPWSSDEPAGTMNGRLVAHARHGRRETTVAESFFEKPWVEDFSGFANARPGRRFLIARSQEACTSESQATAEAIEDARSQLTALVEQVRPMPGGPIMRVTARDVQETDILVDTFVQSFDGSAGPIWRQALLIDASPEKLAWLNSRMNMQAQRERVDWARMIASALGVFAVILVTYCFLNMATRGYYDWSLRIAGLILAIVGVVFIVLLL